MALAKVGHLGYDTMKFEKALKRIPCRETQIGKLISLFGGKESVPCPAIFVYGHTATGKSLVVKTLLKVLELQHVLVNCVECFTGRLLYEHILYQLEDIDDGTDLFPPRCENVAEFLRLLKLKATKLNLEKETLYIVLDKAERLRDMDANVLAGFLRLQELAGLNFCVILLSEITWEKFFTGTGFLDPITVHFPDYSKSELQKIMCLDRHEDHPLEFYGSYCQLLLSVFHTVCRDLNELRHLAALHLTKYCEPITNNEATFNDSHKLWRNINPHLKRALNTVYLREVSSEQWEAMLTQEAQTDSGGSSLIVPQRSHIELPFYSKYLLVAAYIASYNPPRTDKRFFSKKAPRMSNKAKAAAKTNKGRVNCQLTGPKAFPLDRLMAIFYTIVEDNVAPSASILSQITSLVSLNLLSQTSADDQIDAAKYKCLVSFDFIRGIAKQLDFDIVQYLFDFV
ncbi:origin recognition complex subunit 5 [Nematostella vectensis]|uniref:origin recognition complex subunit 5 n=1 Tax=Nematostella vectensis TaxID=45351 RepID=UPI00207786C8|nr:origin recognition complex subunit 5 [Nematostella vectensis]